MNVEKKRRQEQQTIKTIIGIYCHGHHHRREPGEKLCPECQALAAYAVERIEKCPRMEVKSFCSVCPIHCYAPAKREEIQKVMRYGGPCMLLHHPLMTLHHMFLTWQTKRLEEKTNCDM
ncbi:nitrous oxide-stimulated promoter family protein [Mitsuokella sp. WILCCON 0060]|uniref:nitrous oxide-stimulated promoter family protein n=1 Tax=Mitsuokella sp. WILCCON 0060 TaxID=3345341 RepID=UPI003F1C402E